MAFVSMVGRLVQDPSVKYTQQGKGVTSFTLADIHKFTDDQTLFIDVATFGKAAETAARYLKKGSMIEVSGVLKQDSWTGNDGKTRKKFSIDADRLTFVPAGKRDELVNGEGRDSVKQGSQSVESSLFDEDMPF